MRAPIRCWLVPTPWTRRRSIGWRKSGKWDWNLPKVLIPVADTADADGWTQTDWCVIVPDGADGFGLKFDVRQNAGEKAWFDDVSVVSIGNL